MYSSETNNYTYLHFIASTIFKCNVCLKEKQQYAVMVAVELPAVMASLKAIPVTQLWV